VAAGASPVQGKSLRASSSRAAGLARFPPTLAGCGPRLPDAGRTSPLARACASSWCNSGSKRSAGRSL
jgi:hypothetical protein